MQAVQVVGRFVNEYNQPLDGEVEFIPSRLWVDEGDQSYPPLAPRMNLISGRFVAYLTRTDQHGLPWYYVVRCPVGLWKIEITQDGPIKLKDLLPKRFA